MLSLRLSCVAIFALFCVAFAADERKSYDGYKIYKVVPTTEDQINLLKKFHDQELYNFWVERIGLNVESRILISPTEREEFIKIVEAVGFKPDVAVENVQILIDAQKVAPFNVHSRNTDFSWDAYHTLDDINSWLDSLAAAHPDNVEVIIGGSTYEGREIKGVKLTLSNSPNVAMIEGGIHAREWISPATVTYIINEFLTSTDPQIRTLAETFEWHMFPVVNPDGYVYTFDGDRMWRKSRYPYVEDCAFGVSSYGADLNRNFDIFWNTAGTENTSCSNTYAGPQALSEVESQTLSAYIGSISANMKLYISFHSYTQLLIVPYGHTPDHLDNYADVYEMGVRAADSIAQRYGTVYRVGNAPEVLYAVSGSTVDWVRSTQGVELSFLIELRDLGEYGFLLPAEQILPNNLETMDGLITLVEHGSALGYYELVTVSGAVSARSTALFVVALALLKALSS